MEFVLNRINNLVEMNLFCTQPPEFLAPLQNQTVVYGTDAQFKCPVKSNSETTVTWLSNDTVITGETLATLTITNVTNEDTLDKYNCIAGNVVANITSNDAFLSVVQKDTNECETLNGGCQQICHNFNGSFICLCPPRSILLEDNISCKDVSGNSVSSSVRLIVEAETTDQVLYRAIIKMLQNHFIAVTGKSLSVFINGLRKGSVIADYTVVYKVEDNNYSTADVIVKSIMDMEVGATLMLNGTPVHAYSVLPVSSSDPCKIRQLLAGECAEGWTCTVEIGKPYCMKDSGASTSSTNTMVIVAIVVGCALVVGLIVLSVFTMYVRRFRKKYRLVRRNKRENRARHWNVFWKKGHNEVPESLTNQEPSPECQEHPSADLIESSSHDENTVFLTNEDSSLECQKNNSTSVMESSCHDESHVLLTNQEPPELKENHSASMIESS